MHHPPLWAQLFTLVIQVGGEVGGLVAPQPAQRGAGPHDHTGLRGLNSPLRHGDRTDLDVIEVVVEDAQGQLRAE